MSNLSGTVFILVNDAMPRFVRLEFTSGDDAAAKIAKTNKSALPVPFRLYFAAEVADWKALERSLRFLFSKHYDPDDQAFLTINPDLLRAAIEPSVINAIELSDKDLGISPQKRAQMGHLRAANEDLNMQALNAKPGTILYFANEPSISCTALGNGLVQLDGKSLTPVQAAQVAMRKIGFDWDEIAGSDYWIKLSAQAQSSHVSNTSAVHVETIMPEKPIVPNDADDSPVMVIRNKKL